MSDQKQQKQPELNHNQIIPTAQTLQQPSKDSQRLSRQPRDRSRQKDASTKPTNKQQIPQKPQQNNHEKSAQQQSYPQEQIMMNVMGFSAFKTSKNKDHTKSSVEAVFKNSAVARKYRQYMNRPGNFNRNLDAMK